LAVEVLASLTTAYVTGTLFTVDLVACPAAVHPMHANAYLTKLSVVATSANLELFRHPTVTLAAAITGIKDSTRRTVHMKSLLTMYTDSGIVATFAKHLPALSLE
jgi:hypothetical protein